MEHPEAGAALIGDLLVSVATYSTFPVTVSLLASSKELVSQVYDSRGLLWVNKCDYERRGRVLDPSVVPDYRRYYLIVTRNHYGTLVRPYAEDWDDREGVNYAGYRDGRIFYAAGHDVCIERYDGSFTIVVVPRRAIRVGPMDWKGSTRLLLEDGNLVEVNFEEYQRTNRISTVYTEVIDFVPEPSASKEFILFRDGSVEQRGSTGPTAHIRETVNAAQIHPRGYINRHGMVYSFEVRVPETRPRSGPAICYISDDGDRRICVGGILYDSNMDILGRDLIGEGYIGTRANPYALLGFGRITIADKSYPEPPILPKYQPYQGRILRVCGSGVLLVEPIPDIPHSLVALSMANIGALLDHSSDGSSPVIRSTIMIIQ